MSSPCVDIDTNKMYLACLAAYERLAYEGIRILALAFPYDAPLPPLKGGLGGMESAGLPAREVKNSCYSNHFFLLTPVLAIRYPYDS